MNKGFSMTKMFTWVSCCELTHQMYHFWIEIRTKTTHILNRNRFRRILNVRVWLNRIYNIFILIKLLSLLNKKKEMKNDFIRMNNPPCVYSLVSLSFSPQKEKMKGCRVNQPEIPLALPDVFLRDLHIWSQLWGHLDSLAWPKSRQRTPPMI